MRRLFLLFTLLLILVTACKNSKKDWTQQEGYKRQQDSIRIVDSLKQLREQEIAYANQLRLDSLARVGEERRMLEETSRYHIIIGSFITPEFADEYSVYYESLGYATSIYTAENGFDLVSAMDLDNFSEALYQLENFRDTVEVEAWIYIYP